MAVVWGIEKNGVAAMASAVLMVLLFGKAKTAWAGAWTPPKGQGVFIQTTTQSYATQGFGDSGAIDQAINFRKTETQAYMEVGINDRIALIGQASLQDQDITNRFGQYKYFGVGEVGVGMRMKAWERNNWVLSVQPSIFYEGQNENYSQLKERSDRPAVELRALLGYAALLNETPIYFDAQIARRTGFSIIPDSWRADFTAGIRMSDHFELTSQVFLSDTAFLNSDDRIALPTLSAKAQMSILYHRSEKRSYQFGLIQTAFGQNTVRETAFAVGVWSHF